MRCPLCCGPVHEAEGGFECQLGPRVDGDRLAGATDLALAEALWMGVQALDNEAEVLRALGDPGGDELADDAEGQKVLLRMFARRHAQRIGGAERTGGAGS